MVIMASMVYNQDITLDDSDKTFTVPAGKCWRLQFLQGQLATTATAGNRQMAVIIGDGTNTVWYKLFGSTQAASLIRRYYASVNLPDDVAFDSAGGIRMGMLDWVIPAGWTVRLYDAAAIAPAADDLEYRLMVEEFVP